MTTVAGPRRPYWTGTYTGEELRRAPIRPGATDALQIPSLFNGRRVEREEMRREITAPAPTYVPPQPAARQAEPKPPALRPTNMVFSSGAAQPFSDAAAGRRFFAVKPARKHVPRKPAEDYAPQPASIVGQCLARLKDGRGFMLFSEIDQLLGTTQANRRQIFFRALKTGMVKRIKIGQASAYALPDFVLPPELVPVPRMPAAKLRGLQQRLARWQSLRRELTLRLHAANDQISTIERQLAPYLTEHGQPDAARASL